MDPDYIAEMLIRLRAEADVKKALDEKRARDAKRKTGRRGYDADISEIE